MLVQVGVVSPLAEDGPGVIQTLIEKIHDYSGLFHDQTQLFHDRSFLFGGSEQIIHCFFLFVCLLFFF